MHATSKFKSTPTFTFKGRSNMITKSNRLDDLPSPNKYNPEKISYKKSVEIKFPQSKRRDWDQVRSKQFLPGPGTHETISYITEGPKKTINRVRYRESVNKNPSPGHYNNDTLIIKRTSPSFSMQKRTISMHELTFEKNKGKPSPCDYQQQPQAKFNSTQSISIGRSKRPINISSAKTPGPGSYETEKSVSTSSKCKLGKQLRKINFGYGQRSPGPCNYQQKSFTQQNEIKKRGFSCRQKIETKFPQAFVPGPGRYETPLLMHKNRSAPSIKMPKSLRKLFTDQSIEKYKDNPGPGSHELQKIDKVKYTSMSVHKFGKSKTHRELLQNNSMENLSPFSYNAAYESLNKNKAFQFTHQKKGLSFGKIEKKPGPSDYDPKVNLLQKSEIMHKISKSKRPNMIKHIMNNPGPSDYSFETNERLGRKFKFSKELRKNYHEEKIKRQTSQVSETYQSRQEFPNPPKYMGVTSKVIFNEKKIAKYLS